MLQSKYKQLYCQAERVDSGAIKESKQKLALSEQETSLLKQEN